ncbi:hypothetical protein Tco_0124345 [Tanacetum coccineum]
MKSTTPIEAHKALGKDKEGEDVDVHLYRSMIGCLMYLTASRPDIMFVVCLCARFQVTPKVSHMHAVKRIFRYLKHQSKLEDQLLVDVNILEEDWSLVKVRWNLKRGPEFTWERKDYMKSKYPQLFVDRGDESASYISG